MPLPSDHYDVQTPPPAEARVLVWELFPNGEDGWVIGHHDEILGWVIEDGLTLRQGVIRCWTPLPPDL